MELVHSDFRDLGLFQALAVSQNGQLAMLASRSRLAVVDLDRAQQPLCKADRKYMEEVKEIQFSYGQESLAALCEGPNIELVDFGRSQVDSVGSWKAHGNFVTDLSWHEQETNLLATSSVDRHIYIWDFRSKRVPVLSLCASSGSSQVCWERIEGNTLATSNQGQINIWDRRNPSSPIKYINAHDTRPIFALDYSTKRKNYLVSSSKDQSVKFWDTEKTCLRPEKSLTVPQALVWKVRYTPFGEGLVTLLLHTATHHENSLMMWNAHRLESPVHTFFGHNDIILEFCWRNLDPDAGRSEYQLVTYSKDLSLRVCTIGERFQTRMYEGDEVPEIAPAEDDPGRYDDDEIEVLPDPVEDEEHIHTSVKFEVGDESRDHSSSERDPTTTSSGVDIPPGSEETSSDVYDETEDDDDDSARSFEPLKEDVVSSSYRSEHLGDPHTPEVPMSVPSSGSSSIPRFSSSLKTASMFPVQSGLRPSTAEDLMNEYRGLIMRDNLTMERFHEHERFCILRVDTQDGALWLQITFPDQYPIRVAPRIEMFDSESSKRGTAAREERQAIELREANLLTEMKKKAQNLTDRNKKCLQHLARVLEQFAHEVYKRKASVGTAENDFYNSNVLGGMKDANVPFPRFCGARFCANGTIVVFGTKIRIPPMSKQQSSIPRSLQLVSAQFRLSNDPTLPSVRSHWEFFRRLSKSRINSIGSEDSRSKEKTDNNEENGAGKFPVMIYNCSKLIPIVPEMAIRCNFSMATVAGQCYMNTGHAYALGNLEQAHTWSMLFAVARNLWKTRAKDKPCEECKQPICLCNFDETRELNCEALQGRFLSNELSPWSQSPLGRSLVESLLEHHIRIHDFQTASMILALFDPPKATPAPTLGLKRVHTSSLPISLSNKNLLGVSSSSTSSISGKSYTEQNYLSLPSGNSTSSDMGVSFHQLRGAAAGKRVHSSKSECDSGSYHVEHEHDVAMEAVSFRLNHSQSQTAMSRLSEEDSEDDEDDSERREEENLEAYRKEIASDMNVIDPAHAERNELVKLIYAKQLRGLGMVLPSVQMTKNLKVPSRGVGEPTAFTISRMCTKCGTEVGQNNLMCSSCTFKDRSYLCSLCRLPIRGSTCACLTCGHGGHPTHIKSWFLKRDICPAGCGCYCKSHLL